MRKIIDQQVRRNDAGISAIKTICNVHGVNIERNIIEDAVPLDQNGASLSNMQQFLEDYGFETEFRLLDIQSINGNYADIKDFFPCITPVKNKDSVQYVVIDEIYKEKLSILDPSKQESYKLSVQQFRKQAHFKASYLDYASEEEKLHILLQKELNKRAIVLPLDPTKRQLMEMHNKLNYFKYVDEHFGFKSKEAGTAFLKDLLFNQELNHIPEHFRTMEVSGTQIEIKAPFILTVKKKRDIVIPEGPKENGRSVYMQLYKSVGHIKELWFIFLSTILLAAFISYIAVFIDQILIDHILPSYQLGTLQLFAIGVGIFYLIETIFKIYSKFVSIHLSATLDRFFLGTFDAKLNTFSMRYLGSFKRGDLIERMRDSMKLKSFFVKFFSQVLVNVIIATFSLFFLVLINWQLSLLVLLVLVLFAFQFVYFTPLIEKLERKRYIRKADYVSKFIEKIDGIQVVKSLGLESYSSQQIKTRVDALIDVYIESKYVGLANTVISSLIVSFATLALIVLTSRELILYNSISLGMIITFVALSKKIFNAFSKLLNANLSLQEHKVILQRFFDFNENKTQKRDNEYSKQNKSGKIYNDFKTYQDLSKIKTFEFEKFNVNKVSFSYDPDQPILKKVSMEICKGDKIWIQGKNGSGKSTLCKLVTQLYTPDSGDLLINDVHIGMYDTKAVSKKIALIAGKDILFNDTLLFNITFGKKVDIRELIEYAKMINLYEFINEKPDKFDFMIHENGKNLSTGQRRKILLLRAMMLDAEVIILDEVFNGIDKESKERAEFMLDLIEDKTIVIISHMPVSRMTFNKKYLVENGVLIDQNA